MKAIINTNLSDEKEVLRFYQQVLFPLGFESMQSIQRSPIMLSLAVQLMLSNVDIELIQAAEPDIKILTLPADWKEAKKSAVHLVELRNTFFRHILATNEISNSKG